VFFAAMRSLTAFEGLRHPWSYLEPSLTQFDVESLLSDGVYIASGFKNAASRSLIDQ